MSDRLKALREKRGVAVKEMRDLLAAADAEKRDLTPEELQKHTAAFNVVDGLREQIEAEERTAEAARVAAEDELRARESGADADNGKKPAETDAEKRHMDAFRKYLLLGETRLSEEEKRTLQSGSDTEGGYTKPPPQFIAQLLKNVDNMVFIRGRATKYTVKADNSLGVPTLDTDQDDFTWTTELLTGNEDTAMRFGKRELKPHPMAKRIKVSKTLLRASALPIENIINDRMSYKLGITQEKAYLTGNGNQRPLGLFTASNDGIPTTQDVSTGNSTTAIAFDGLIEAKYKLKAQYWPAAAWLFHRDAVKALTKIKDGDGQYIWRVSVRDGEPDSLLGKPVMISEYVPNTFTTGLYVGMFADFSYYWIADSLDFQVQRLVELYAETNQDGFIARYEGDGMPVLAEAFARVTLA